MALHLSPSPPACAPCPGLRRAPCSRPVLARAGAADASTLPDVQLPRTYLELHTQARAALSAARRDGVLLQEVHFPPCGLEGVAGDVEGNVENNANQRHTRELVSFLRGDELQRARVWMPDATELHLSRVGTSGTSDGVPAPDSASGAGPFASFSGRMSVLFEPSIFTVSGLSRMLGRHPRASQRSADDDSVHVVSYPSGNIDEMLETCELHEDRPSTPLIVVNGELERVRSGYYPAFWARAEMGPLRLFCPQFQQVYLLHNFKGSNPAVLFRAYPGPFRVLLRQGEGYVCIHETQSYPSLKAVATEIIPAALAERRRAAAAKQAQ